MNGKNVKVLYCVFTLLALTTFTCSQNDGKNESIEQQKITYNGAQVFRVKTMKSKENAKKTIEEMEKKNLIHIWSTLSGSVDMVVKKEHLGIVKDALTNQSLPFKILIENVKQAIDEERSPLNKSRSDKRGKNLKFDYFYELHEIYEYIDRLSQEHSNFVEVENIGKSFEGVPLMVVKIRADNNVQTRNTVWIDGGIHAREWISVSSVLYVIHRLVNKRDSLEAHMKDTEFHILPIINPDGYKYSHENDRFWRKNRNTFSENSVCVGTDLNRNWDYHWGGEGTSNNTCSDIYHGIKAASEPETQAMARFMMRNPSVYKAYLSFHSYGQYIMYPWGYSHQMSSDRKELHRVGQVMAEAIKNATAEDYTVGNSAELLYPAAGGSFDWTKGVAKIKYSYTIELRDKGQHGFLLPSSEILSTGKDAFAAVSALSIETH